MKLSLDIVNYYRIKDTVDVFKKCVKGDGARGRWSENMKWKWQNFCTEKICAQNAEEM